ncbi:MAG TPA: immunoglobulin domain-containing protein [Burkholderiaceae bacterium]|nr:immunoglobulin domain-containing protein [Burkholderiaceae bacterium]
MKKRRQATFRPGLAWIPAATALALLQLASCNGDPLDTSATGSSQAPEIEASPQSISVPAGQSVTFTVSATGAAPLTYQWQQGGTDIAGATASSYTLSDVQATQTGSQFDVVVSNSFGSATSGVATLTVD